MGNYINQRNTSITKCMEGTKTSDLLVLLYHPARIKSFSKGWRLCLLCLGSLVNMRFRLSSKVPSLSFPLFVPARGWPCSKKLDADWKRYGKGMAEERGVTRGILFIYLRNNEEWEEIWYISTDKGKQKDWRKEEEGRAAAKEEKKAN